jgi:hypothetical protein
MLVEVFPDHVSKPYVNCFDDFLQEADFINGVDQLRLNLPVNITSTPDFEDDLERQVSFKRANLRAAVKKCSNLTGEALAYLGGAYICHTQLPPHIFYTGTQAVVQDIDYMSKVFDGDDKPINCECIGTMFSPSLTGV